MSQPERKTADAPGPTPWGHNYIDVESMPWQPSRLAKSMQKTLYSDEASGVSTVLFRMEPGGVIPYHEHPELEQTYILKGKLVDHLGECTAGNFVWRAPGSRHTAHCPEGAEFIVFFLKPPLRLPEP
jgi:quercetin dioxygenase-like cupin family protein